MQPEHPPTEKERAMSVGVCFYCDHVDEDWNGSNQHPVGEGDACGPVMSPADAGDYALNEIDTAQQQIAHALCVIATASDYLGTPDASA